jgi:polysaccharide biosynthesis protein PslH
MNILWVKTGPLHPVDTGGRKRTHAMLRELAKEHHVTYLALKDTALPLHPDEETDDYAQEKIWIPWSETPKRSWRILPDLLKNLLASELPYSISKYLSPGMAGKISELDASGRFDLLVCDFIFPAPNFGDIANLRTPSVLFQHNVEAEIWRRLAESQTHPLKRWFFQRQFQRMERSERRLAAQFGGVINVSAHDSEICRTRYQLANVLGEVPTGVDTSYFTPRSDDFSSAAIHPTLGFLGSMDWNANIDAVDWFLTEAFPSIRKKQPTVRFRVIGRNPPIWLTQKHGTTDGVEFTGTVDDVRPYAAGCDLIVIPLRVGSGTRLKILECMAMGIPVLSTTIGAEGLNFTPGTHLEISDTIEELIAKSLELLAQPPTLTRLATDARAKVTADHSWHAATRHFTELCQKAIPSF